MKQVTKTGSSAFNRDHLIKSKGKISKQKDKMYKSSFMDVPDRTIYWDPQGFMKGESIDLKEKMWKEWEDKGIVEKFDSLQQEEGYPLEKAIDHIAKNYDTTDWNIPVFFVPEVRVVQPERTPIADNIPRVTVDSDSINITAETDQPDPTFGLETTDDTEGSYTYADGTYTDYTYDVVGYGVATRLEDKLVLAADALRSTQSVAEQAHVNGIRQTEERQILRGTENDSAGFDGMKDLGTLEQTVDLANTIDWKSVLRDLISEVEYQGGNRGNIAVAVDFDTFNAIANDLEDEVRYVDPGEELGYGFQALKFDGVQIWKTNGLIKQDNISTDTDETIMVAADMGSNYMGMLQDMTVKPLAKVGPQEQFATDVYGTFVSEAPAHIRYVNATGE